MSIDHDWRGARILVVEDSPMFGEVLCDYLSAQQIVAVGPATRLEAACSLARDAELDGAMIDIKLGDRFSFPVCLILSERAIPFFFLTGYAELSVIPSEYRKVPIICKPFLAEEMEKAFQMMLRR